MGTHSGSGYVLFIRPHPQVNMTYVYALLMCIPTHKVVPLQ